MRRANAAKTFPGSGPAPPGDSGETAAGEDPNAAKTFAGSEANPAKTFPGSAVRPRFTAAAYRTAIAEKLDAGLSLQRIWQDLVEEFGYAASHESVKRFVRTIVPRRRAVGVFHCAPGAERQFEAHLQRRRQCRAHAGEHAIHRTQTEGRPLLAQQAPDLAGWALRIFEHQRPDAGAHRFRDTGPTNVERFAGPPVIALHHRRLAHHPADGPHGDPKLLRNRARRDLRPHQLLYRVSIQHPEHPPIASGERDRDDPSEASMKWEALRGDRV
jgi:hypothetical protein